MQMQYPNHIYSVHFIYAFWKEMATCIYFLSYNIMGIGRFTLQYHRWAYIRIHNGTNYKGPIKNLQSAGVIEDFLKAVKLFKLTKWVKVVLLQLLWSSPLVIVESYVNFLHAMCEAYTLLLSCFLCDQPLYAEVKSFRCST